MGKKSKSRMIEFNRVDPRLLAAQLREFGLILECLTPLEISIDDENADRATGELAEILLECIEKGYIKRR